MPKLRFTDNNSETADTMTLQLDCWSDELSPAQLAAFTKAERERNDVRGKLDEIVSTGGGESLFLGEIFSAYTIPGPAAGIEEIAKPIAKVRKDLIATKKISDEKKRESSVRRRDYKHVIDDDDDEYIPISKRLKNINKGQAKETKREAERRDKFENDKRSSNQHKIKGTTSSIGPDLSSTPTIPSSFRPTENTSIGGLSVGTLRKKEVVDLTKDDCNKTTADSREITFNKLQGKTYPSLVVVARPSLKTKDTASDRLSLDTKVKGVLMHTATKFTEWLIQQGLVRSEQTCQIHPHTNLKLGMYSDATKFPYSGGYVWISECCPTRFVSVFSGSLFEGGPHPPSVLLKLIYHWACQTNVQNVVQWVKVDNLYVKEFYARLRSVCTVALYHHLNLLGGPGKRIEVGVISLGTTSQDGQQRQVKVEVLGVLDPESKIVRLRAVEPLSDGERNYKKRFLKILEPLPNWVSKESIVVTDLTVDKSTLNIMGFKYVTQDTNTKNANGNIMDYLRRIVPRMFQNTLSLLSRQIIQQFLDELVWREWYGTTPGVAFDNIVAHISEQTRYDGKESLVARLGKVSANPFKNWSHISSKLIAKSVKDGKFADPLPSTSGTNVSSLSASKAGRGRKRKELSPEYQPRGSKDEIKTYGGPQKKITKSNNEKEELKKEKEQTIFLEQYYYGVIKQTHLNDSGAPVKFKVKCPFCTDHFTTNITLMNHLKQHANEPEEKSVQCVYCLDNWADEDKLAKHHALAHPIETKSSLVQGGVACIICEIRFSTNAVLATHMQKTHIANDLPYRCGCCNYASSCLRYAIDHFNSSHANSGILQCPICLQIYAAVTDGQVLSTNIIEYVDHLRLHLNKQNAKKCNNCASTFITKGALKVHQIYAHSSHSKKSIKIEATFKNTTKIPKPRLKHGYNKDHSLYLSKYNKLVMFLENGFICLECNTDFEEFNHISGFIKCQKCKYHTCCLRAMMEHSTLCDSANNQEITSFSPLEEEMHCICGFSSLEGNALARHLVTCERFSAYGSVELAQENTVKRNMLDMLGLVRRDEDEESDDLLLPATESDRNQVNSEDGNQYPHPNSQAISTDPDAKVDLLTESDESKTVNKVSNSEVSTEVQSGTNCAEEQIESNEPNQFITQLSLDDLAPPSIAPLPETDRTPQLRDEYQSLATPRVGSVHNDNNEV